MKKYICYGIKYVTDGQNVNLPPTVTVEDVDDDIQGEELEELLSDSISDQTGFLHEGFQYSGLTTN